MKYRSRICLSKSTNLQAPPDYHLHLRSHRHIPIPVIGRSPAQSGKQLKLSKERNGHNSPRLDRLSMAVIRIAGVSNMKRAVRDNLITGTLAAMFNDR